MPQEELITPEEFKYFCECGCKAFAMPVTFTKDFILERIQDCMTPEELKKFDQLDFTNNEFYNHKEPWHLRICSGTKPFVNDLAFPKDHYLFNVDKPRDFNAVAIYNRFNHLITVPFLIEGDCKCTNNGLPVK